MAHHLNRTLLVDPEVSKYYDIDILSLSTYGDTPYLAAMPIGSSKYPNPCPRPQSISPHTINHALTILERIKDYNKQTSGKGELVSVDNNDVWYWLGRPPEDVYERFFRGLIPKREILEKVNAFMAKHKIGQEDAPYNALHLRHFEGKCGHNDKDLCCPLLEHVQGIVVEHGGNILDPLFVANDRQCPELVQVSYTNATNETDIIMGYDGPCDGTECAVLDFELCIHADVFVGNLKSSGDMNIREWRLARYNKVGWTSVLSRQKDAMEMEAKTKYITRYVMGHWRFRPDCSNTRDRGKPCV